MIYCLPIAKSNWPEGRIGPEKLQDSYRIIKTAVGLVKNNTVDKLLIFSAFKTNRVRKIELDCMIDTCKTEKLPEDKMIVQPIGYDTISVIQYAIDMCKKDTADLLIVSSQFHHLRIRWITSRIDKKGVTVKHKMIWGITRPQETLTDILLIFLYPVIDLFGYSFWFTNHIKIRRDKGYLL